MRGWIRGHGGRATRAALAATLVLTKLPAGSVVGESPGESLPDCRDLPSPPPAAEVIAPWQVVLDEAGVVTEHRLTLRRQEETVTLRVGRRGFAIPGAPGRLLVGERSSGGTTLLMLDTEHACLLWSRSLDRLAFDASRPADGPLVRLDVHDPLTRWYEGQALLEAESGRTVAMIDGVCSTSCEPNDGTVSPADLAPAGAARPVPAFPAGGWPRDTLLPFGWQNGALPPDWARTPLLNGAADTSSTSASRSPSFVFRSGAPDTVRYTPAFPTFCRYGIACASRDMPEVWAVWLRPHGTDFSWGTLRWCQREDSSGCFDLRRVMIHELGHVAGLDHPSSAGFTLDAEETVMHAITPARPSPGSTRHAFGRCDVATLQELYDVPTNTTPISTCNDVATELTLSVSSTAVVPGQSVRLRAELRVPGLDSLGLLGGNPLNGRSVKLKYRRAGSSDPWTTLWMAPLGTGGAYDLTIAPQATWEYQATFPAPVDEGLRFSASETLKVRLNR